MNHPEDQGYQKSSVVQVVQTQDQSKEVRNNSVNSRRNAFWIPHKHARCPAHLLPAHLSRTNPTQHPSTMATGHALHPVEGGQSWKLPQDKGGRLFKFLVPLWLSG